MEIISLNNLDSAGVKTKLLYIINKIIEKNAWTQAFAAEKLGIDQPKVSQIKNGKIDGFSLERLLGFLKKFNHEITIMMTESKEIKSEAEKVKHEVESQ
ncbi:MAG: helix-turn-helix domain-containing protein [Wolbachia pipientis]|jgi:predicted XRE-type DNA-binding protein|nr:helix-turn-helix domain-containing protein [Wolbachia pipientis]